MPKTEEKGKVSPFFLKLENEVIAANEQIKEFKKKFSESPVYALSWADTVFYASVCALLGKDVLKWNRTVSHAELRENIMKRLVDKSSSMTRSTSPSANLVRDMEIQFWAKMADNLSWHPHA